MDHVIYEGVALPPADLRPCGRDFKTDRHWLGSARSEADRLVRDLALTSGSQVLDIGCGPGRLAVGIVDRLGIIEAYRGLDVDRRVIDWSTRYITTDHPTFQFLHLDVSNPRYNPGGRSLNGGVSFGFRDERFSIIYLYSVFSHMVERDVRIYLKEIARLLAPEGRIFMTGFIEENVPEMTANPDEYGRDWKGPLHQVRFERDFFESMLDESGLSVDRFDHGIEDNGQSALYASRKRAGDARLVRQAGGRRGA